jgi:hypothetical protein
MELPGSNYLYGLATISITFVGFSALLLVFRQTIGGSMTPYDRYFTLSFMLAGFIVTAGGLLPQLLALYGIAPIRIWRACSIIMALPIFLFVATTPARRRAASDAPIPPYIWGLLCFQLLAGVYLVFNAFGWPTGPDLAPYALAMTVMLFTTGVAYLVALGRALQPLN